MKGLDFLLLLSMIHNIPVGYGDPRNIQNECTLNRQCMQAINAVIEERIKEMESKIEEGIWKRIMDVAPNTASSSDAHVNTELETNDCDITYQERCFTFFFADVISLAEAQSRCQRIGAHMANIYSGEHENLIIDRIRKAGSDPFFLFIGMTYNRNTSQVKLYNGSSSQYVRWYPEGNFPQKKHGLIRFIVLPFATGLLNNIASDKAKSHGVLCERIVTI